MIRLSQRGAIGLLIPVLLILGIITVVYLVTNGSPLKLFSKASSEKIEWVSSSGDSQNCVTDIEGKKVTTCPTVKFRINLPTDQDMPTQDTSPSVPQQNENDGGA